jgi:hypothetical protein
MHRYLVIAFLAFPAPVVAQTETQEGLGLIERGLGIIGENLWTEFGPQLDQLGQGMGNALTDLGPVLQDLAVLVDDLGNYQAPERLENGDILIRRKADAPPPPPLPDAPSADGDATPSVPVDPDQPEIPL